MSGRHGVDGCGTCPERDLEHLTWAEYDTPVGVVRVTQCEDCLDNGISPTFGWAEVAGLAMQTAGSIVEGSPTAVAQSAD